VQLFNGDFVDRGSFSVECIFTLFGFKLLYPDHFFMARGKTCVQETTSAQEINARFSSDRLLMRFTFAGNHESFTMNQMYGFEGEVRAKYTAHMSKLFTEVYNWLPLAHCLNNRVLVSFVCLSNSYICYDSSS